MKKLLLAGSAVALAIAMSPVVISSVQAAPAKSPFCNLAKGQKNLVSWNAYYHCLSSAPAAQPQAAQRYVRTRQAYRQRRYNSGPPAEYAPPSYAQYQPAQDNSQYCKLAKGQKNLVSWNAYYGCLKQR